MRLPWFACAGVVRGGLTDDGPHGLHQEGEGVLGDVLGDVRVVRHHNGDAQQLRKQERPKALRHNTRVSGGQGRQRGAAHSKSNPVGASRSCFWGQLWGGAGLTMIPGVDTWMMSGWKFLT
jgi:hypothetical protein